ncbi:MAG: hypothetical protein ACRET1_06955, partial [Burkholderiales bacterium]
FHQQKFTAVAMTPDGFEAWVRKVRANGAPLDARTLKAISQRTTKAQLVAALPHAAARDNNVYLTGVTPALFPAVVKATMDGTPVQLSKVSKSAAKRPATADPKRAASVTKETR